MKQTIQYYRFENNACVDSFRLFTRKRRQNHVGPTTKRERQSGARDTEEAGARDNNNLAGLRVFSLARALGERARAMSGGLAARLNH